ncbi:MAG: hypothetical protein Q4B54_09375, partial [Coriobacteriales bacterium]|nr:hypothetical protein [Coriobacteriales bacterium]
MLEVLRNGGGKSTLTAIELFSLVPRLGNLRSRMRELFRSSSGPSYVAWKLKRTGKDWAKGYEYLYLICAFERQAGEGQGGEVRRYWAFVPAAYVGEISKLPLTTMENGRLYPTAVSEFDKWVNSIPEAVFRRDNSLTEVEDELRKNGISPKELATQLSINYDEGGIENFFSRGTTSETFFENCLMTVVRDGVWGDRDDNWLVDAVLALTNTARDQQREISKLEVNRSHKDKLELAKDAFETDFAHRKELSELKSRAMKLAEVTEERIGELSVLSEQAEQQLQDLARQERLIDHRDLSIRYYQKYDAQCSSDSQAKALREKSDELEGELQKLDKDLALDDAARAYSEWKPQHADVLALETNIAALEEKSGKLGAETQQLQAGAMAAWEDELARSRATCEDAKQEFARAEQKQREAEAAHKADDEHRLEASSAAGAAREVLAHAQKDLTRASESEPPLEECTRILSEPNLMGNYDQERTAACLQDATKAEATAGKALDQAQRRTDEAQAAVSILEDERNEVARQEAIARAQRDDLAQRTERAQKAFSELEDYLNQANPKPVRAQTVGAFQDAIHATEAELSVQRTEAQQLRGDLYAQLDAFEQRGIIRADAAILSILDELNIPFRTIRHVADEQDIDLETYLRDEPWLADLIFMSEEDALVLSQTLAKRMGADKLVAFVATTDDLDAILAGQLSHVRVCTNANADWVIDPKRWKQKLDE